MCNCSLYAECVDGAGTIEWNTVNDSFVALQPPVGTLYNAPVGDNIFVTNTDNSTSAVLNPGGRDMLIPCLQSMLLLHPTASCGSPFD